MRGNFFGKRHFLIKSNKIIIDKNGEILWVFADNPRIKELLAKSVPYKKVKKI